MHPSDNKSVRDNGNPSLPERKQGKPLSLKARLARKMLALTGWSLHADYPEANAYVLVVAPHTSNWDFILGLFAAWGFDLGAHWMGKHTLFRWPLGWVSRRVGGIPVYRGEGRHLSQQIADRFADDDTLVLGVAPEGTRSKTDHWKSGFYYIAMEAGVPIALASLDYARKQVGIGGTFIPSGSIEADFKKIAHFYADKTARHPELVSDIRPH